MSQSKEREAWNHTADLLCLTANINRDTEARPEPFERAHFHPYHPAPECPDLDFEDCDISVLKVFLQ